DHKDFNLYAKIFPFSELKNKWLQGFMSEMGSWFCNIDQRTTAVNGCSRLQIQDNGDAARQTLFDTGANSIGAGLVTITSPGITWEVGPYRLRAMGTFVNAHDSNFSPNPVALLRGKKQAHDFLIGHDLNLWSPKGWLTG